MTRKIPNILLLLLITSDRVEIVRPDERVYEMLYNNNYWYCLFLLLVVFFSSAGIESLRWWGERREERWWWHGRLAGGARRQPREQSRLFLLQLGSWDWPNSNQWWNFTLPATTTTTTNSPVKPGPGPVTLQLLHHSESLCDLQWYNTAIS